MKLLGIILTLVALVFFAVVAPHAPSYHGGNTDSLIGPSSLTSSGAPSGTTGCGQYPVTGDTLNVLVSGGETRTYILHVPPSYDPAVPLPLMISYHGGGETAAAHEAVAAFDPSVLVVYPQGLTFNAQDGPTWRIVGDSPDVTFTNDLVATLENQLCIDPTHIGVNGISMGGFMAWSMACYGSPWLASIGVVAGRLSTFGPRQCIPQHPISLEVFDGYYDTKVPWGPVPPYVPSVLQEAASWSAQEGCLTTDESTTVTQYYTQTVEVCPSGLDTIVNGVDGGHQWFGSAHTYRPPSVFGNNVPISMTQMLTTFLDTHSLQP